MRRPARQTYYVRPAAEDPACRPWPVEAADKLRAIRVLEGRRADGCFHVWTARAWEERLEPDCVWLYDGQPR